MNRIKINLCDELVLALARQASYGTEIAASFNLLLTTVQRTLKALEQQQIAQALRQAKSTRIKNQYFIVDAAQSRRCAQDLLRDTSEFVIFPIRHTSRWTHAQNS